MSVLLRRARVPRYCLNVSCEGRREGRWQPRRRSQAASSSRSRAAAASPRLQNREAVRADGLLVDGRLTQRGRKAGVSIIDEHAPRVERRCTRRRWPARVPARRWRKVGVIAKGARRPGVDRGWPPNHPAAPWLGRARGPPSRAGFGCNRPQECLSTFPWRVTGSRDAQEVGAVMSRRVGGDPLRGTGGARACTQATVGHSDYGRPADRPSQGETNCEGFADRSWHTNKRHRLARTTFRAKASALQARLRAHPLRAHPRRARCGATLRHTATFPPRTPKTGYVSPLPLSLHSRPPSLSLVNAERRPRPRPRVARGWVLRRPAARAEAEAREGRDSPAPPRLPISAREPAPGGAPVCPGLERAQPGDLGGAPAQRRRSQGVAALALAGVRG